MIRAALVLLAAAASPALAHDYRAGDLVIEHPMAFAPPPGAQTAAGYLSITNTGTAPDTLLEVRADFPRVLLHATTESDGMTSMTEIEGLVIDPGETVTLSPGQSHIMFMGLGDDPLEEGETVPATLVFERAGAVEVVFNVEARGAADGHDEDHEGH